MATRSLISIKNEDGTYDGVYCHFDGYPTGVGSKLSRFYKTEEKIRELIDRGDMSCLEGELDDCEFYTKRGEELHNYKGLQANVILKKALDIGCEYFYTFFKGEWSFDQLYDA